MVKDIFHDFFLKILDAFGDEIQQRTIQLFQFGYYCTPEGGVMDKMKLVLSFEKRIMLKLWTEPNQTELLYVDVGYYDKERLVKNFKARFYIDSDNMLLSTRVPYQRLHLSINK